MRENSLHEPSEEVGNWSLVVRDAEYEGERKSALMKHGEGTNFQGKTNKRFFRYYIYIYIYIYIYKVFEHISKCGDKSCG